MEDDKRLTSKLDCKEIKINKIKEKPAIQSPGSSPPPLKGNLENSVNFKWFILRIWGWLAEVGTLKGPMHGCVFVFFVVLGITPKALVTLGLCSATEGCL